MRQRLEAEARALGFARLGVASPDAVGHVREGLSAFLEAGYHGDMDWLGERIEARSSPRGLWPDCRSVIMLALSYTPDHDPMNNLAARSAGNISVYARGRDYHDVIKRKLKTLARWLVDETGCTLKVFVDTAPVPEKALAAAAGIGWQGKHTNLVSRSLGSWFFLGAIYTTLELTADEPERDHCGRCDACQTVCPTDAFPTPYTLDARRCISYLTIEHRGPIARAFRKPMGNRVFGCDDCLAACPWTKFSEPPGDVRLVADPGRVLPPLADLLALDDPAFRALFAGSPVKRTGRDRFLRNCLIAAGNSGDAALIHPTRALLDDEHPLVRGMAVWALSQLMNSTDFAALREARLPREVDPDVRSEWELGCA